jgi:predicted dehydrogenase
MVEAARKYNVMMQVGFQNRSRRNTNAAMKFLHEGKLGKIYMARGLCYKQRGPIGRYPDGPVAPDTKYHMDYSKKDRKPLYTKEYLSKVHYDMWLGPAPKKPFNANRFHYNWHWHWDYGNGDTGNQGPHQFDVARWGLNKDEYPVKLRSFGGYFAYDSSQETPNTQTSIFEYADGTILEFATRGLTTNPEGILSNTPFQNQAGKLSLKNNYRPIDIGDLFFGSEGWMQIDSGGNWQTFLGYRNEPGPTSEEGGDSVYDPNDLTGGGDEGHFGNFIAALRSGKREDLTCDIEVGHLSTALPLIANISYRLGRELMFDGSKEKFVGDNEADAMLTRDYRAPYVVPQNV